MAVHSTRVVLVVVFFLAGGLAATFLVTSPESVQSELVEPDVDVTVASSQLSPEQVVEIQVSSALASKSNPPELKTCYSLASPSNRLFTGPLERFTQMLFAPPYHHLGDCVAWQVGRAIVHERMAAVLVSVLAADGSTHAYRFYLSKQETAPYEDCWMTDRVEFLTGIEFGQTEDGLVVAKQEQGIE